LIHFPEKLVNRAEKIANELDTVRRHTAPSTQEKTFQDAVDIIKELVMWIDEQEY